MCVVEAAIALDELGEDFLEDKVAALLMHLKDPKMKSESRGAKIILWPRDQFPSQCVVKNAGFPEKHHTVEVYYDKEGSTERAASRIIAQEAAKAATDGLLRPKKRNVDHYTITQHYYPKGRNFEWGNFATDRAGLCVTIRYIG